MAELSIFHESFFAKITRRWRVCRLKNL
jgi:hypothetical protein